MTVWRSANIAAVVQAAKKNHLIPEREESSGICEVRLRKDALHNGSNCFKRCPIGCVRDQVQVLSNQRWLSKELILVKENEIDDREKALVLEMPLNAMWNLFDVVRILRKRTADVVPPGTTTGVSGPVHLQLKMGCTWRIQEETEDGNNLKVLPKKSEG